MCAPQLPPGPIDTQEGQMSQTTTAGRTVPAERSNTRRSRVSALPTAHCTVSSDVPRMQSCGLGPLGGSRASHTRDRERSRCGGREKLQHVVTEEKTGRIEEKLWQSETQIFLHWKCGRLTGLGAICSVHGNKATSIPTPNSWQRRGARRETRRGPAEFTLEIIDSLGDNSTERARAGLGLETTGTSFSGLHQLRFPHRSR